MDDEVCAIFKREGRRSTREYFAGGAYFREFLVTIMIF